MIGRTKEQKEAAKAQTALVKLIRENKELWALNKSLKKSNNEVSKQLSNMYKDIEEADETITAYYRKLKENGIDVH